MKRVACVAGFALLLVAQLTAQTNSAVNTFNRHRIEDFSDE